MNWLCWHVGSCTDPKFGLIAKRTGASLSQVIHIWAYHLERAAQGEPRGFFATIPPDEAEVATGIPQPIWIAVVIDMEERQMILSGHVANFEKRNYGNSTLRVKAYRERQRKSGNGETLQLLPVTTERSSNATGQDRTVQDIQNHKNGSDAGASVNLFNGPLEWLMRATGKSEQQCRSLIGRFRKDSGNDDGVVFNAIMAAQKAGAIEPISYIAAAIKPKPKKKTEQMPL